MFLDVFGWFLDGFRCFWIVLNALIRLVVF